MKVRPILFSAPMVRALLDGRKTQTRRVVKPQPEVKYHSDGEFGQATGWLWAERYTYGNGQPGCVWRPLRMLLCPYGKPGDLLWVRECFSYDRLDVDCDGVLPPWFWADGNPEDGNFSKPKPSIHMPRWASRLTLELRSVRVERLQDISEADKVAEGGTADRPFGTVWRAINTTPGIRWEDNPWVWVLEFKVHRCNVDELLKARAA